MRRPLLVALTLVIALSGWRVEAQGPDYDAPAGFALPWECGQSFRVSWEPEGHWEAGMASGAAWDFGLPEGTPILAPFSGMAYFASDARPLDTTYGHFVEIIDETGQWLVRLAHLQQPGSGGRFVRAGEEIGRSGSSGVVAPHLHLELLVREGSQWVRPDLGALDRLFGVPSGELVVGAFVGCQGAADPAYLAGQVEATPSQLELGQEGMLVVPLANRTSEALHVTLVQVMLYSLEGDGLLAETSGDWLLPGNDTLAISVPVIPTCSGPWFVGRVSWSTEQGVQGSPARGFLAVSEPPLRLNALAGPAGPVQVGEPLALTLWLENTTADPIAVDGFQVDGLRPDGGVWRVSLRQSAVLGPLRPQRFLLESIEPLSVVGEYVVGSVSYLQGETALTFARLTGALTVVGPQLKVLELTPYLAGSEAVVLLRLQNVGTEDAHADALELWGWRPDGERFATQLTGLAPIKAGQGAMVQVLVPLEAGQGTWRFAGAGCWWDGEYLPISLPGQPVLAVESGTSLLAPEGRNSFRQAEAMR